MSNELSQCHQAPVTIGGDDREGTHYYVCSECNQACDIATTVPATPNEPMDVDEILSLYFPYGAARYAETKAALLRWAYEQTLELIDTTAADFKKKGWMFLGGDALRQAAKERFGQ